MKIENLKVYGLDESMKAAHYPMCVDTAKAFDGLDHTVTSLAGSEIGSGHDNFLMGIVVQFDLTFTNKAWVEAERYHFFDIVSSQSTMHRIAKFDLTKAYNNYVDPRMIEIMNELKETYNRTGDKEDYLRLLYSNPAGFELTARITTNYRQLKTIIKQRSNHRLPEWREFCKYMINNLPNIGAFR